MNLDQEGFLAWLGQNGLGIFVVVVVIAVLVVTALVIRALWKPLLRTVLTMNAILQLPETLARHETSLDEMKSDIAALRTDTATVKHEVLPNSGGSLADEVHRQGEQLVNILTVQKSTQGVTRSQGKRLKAIEESLGMTQQPAAVHRARARAGLRHA